MEEKKQRRAGRPKKKRSQRKEEEEEEIDDEQFVNVDEEPRGEAEEALTKRKCLPALVAELQGGDYVKRRMGNNSVSALVVFQLGRRADSLDERLVCCCRGLWC